MRIEAAVCETVTLIREAGLRQLDGLWVSLLGHLSDGSYCGQTGISFAVAGKTSPHQINGMRIAFHRHLSNGN